MLLAVRMDKHIRTYAQDEETTPASLQFKTRVKLHEALKFKAICQANDWSEAQGIRAGIKKLIDDCGTDLVMPKKKYY